MTCTQLSHLPVKLTATAIFFHLFLLIKYKLWPDTEFTQVGWELCYLNAEDQDNTLNAI